MSEKNEEFKLKEDSFDFKIIVFFIIRNWYIFLISVFIAFLISYLYNKYTQPVYKVHTTILIKENKFNNQEDNSELLALKGFEVSRNIQNEIGIIKSFSLAYKTLKELPQFEVFCYTETKRSKKTKELFGDDCPFNVLLDTSHFQTSGVPINIEIISKDRHQANLPIPTNGMMNIMDHLNYREVDETTLNTVVTKDFGGKKMENPSERYFYRSII